MSPLETFSATSGMPTTHGIPRERESIAVWLVCEPFSVTIAKILLLSTREKSAGAKSELTSTSGSLKAPILAVWTPSMLPNTLRDTSLKSAMRSFMYGSSMRSKAAINLFMTLE